MHKTNYIQVEITKTQTLFFKIHKSLLDLTNSSGNVVIIFFFNEYVREIGVIPLTVLERKEEDR
jgi:hypothetical protein